MTHNIQTNHPSVPVDTFATIEDYVIHLMHRKIYEDAAALSKGRNVLDWGCNNGWGLPIMARTASRVGGLDTNEGRVLEARERYPEFAQNIWLYDGRNIPFTERDWDVVVSFQVIEHVQDLDAYVGAIRSILKDKGVVMFTTPNREIRLDEGMVPWNKFHATEFNAEQLGRVLQKHFRYVDVYGLQGDPEITDVERNRSSRQRENARKQKTVPERILRKIRTTVKSTIGSALASSAPAASRVPDSVIQRFSTSQLEYTKQDLKTAVDLLAICSNEQVKLPS
jgi:2-polyprenyl-3-methyl-5-hydroxy-6-metoxy-1,4-benzoquinol methylase